MGPWSSKPSSPPTVATDKVVPLHFWDDNQMLRPIIPEVTLRFNDALDVAKIRFALDRLLNREGWRKLGARTRMNKNGKLEYHIPHSYTEERPGFILTEERYNVCIEEHPLGSKLPRPPSNSKQTPIFVGDPMEFVPIVRSPDAPTKLDDWLYNDIPTLIFHAASFENATLFTVTWCHTLMDAMGLSAVLNALSLILQGRDDEVPEFLGAVSDPLVSMGKDAKPEDFILYEYLLNGISGIRFGINMAIDLLYHRNNCLRQICIPSSYFKRIYAQARSELNFASNLAEDCDLATSSEDEFVSESDVLFAWWVRTLVPALEPLRKDTPIGLMNVFDFRSLVQPDLLTKGSVYVANGTFAIFKLLPAWQILTTPLSSVALSLRKSLTEQRTRPQLEAVAAAHRTSIEKSGMAAMFGEPGMYLLVCSNWHRGKLYQVDFSAALLDPSKRNQNPLAGKPTYIHPVGYNNGFQIRNFGAVSGKDHEGNWWLSWYTSNDTWDIVERVLRESTPPT